MGECKIQILVEIIVRIKLGTATNSDWLLLENWLNEGEDNLKLYQSIMNGEEIKKRLKLKNEIEKNIDYDQLEYHILHKIASRRRIRRMVVTGSIAAACFTGLILNTLLLRKPDIIPEKVVLITPEEELKPDKVVLVLESGEQIGLIKNTPDSIIAGQAVILNKKGLLSYQPRQDSLIQEEKKNRIVTYTGAEYSFFLSDSTRVWLNASTTLEFASVFTGRERVVTLTGEAYFEVKHDEKRPFIVRTGDIQTKVLGTTFNINAYPDEKEILTTLLTGKVEVSLAGKQSGKNRVILTPEMQSKWIKGSDRFQVSYIKTNDVIAWKSGIFVFNEDEIGVVLRVLARWYDVQFQYDPETLKGHTFSGRISKDEPLSYILETFTMAQGPKFEFIDNQIIKVENQ